MVRQLALGNGSLLVNLDGSLRVSDVYFPYAGQENHVRGEPHRVGIHADGFSWLEQWDTAPSYRDDTIVGESRAENGEEGLEIVFRDAVECQRNVFLRELRLANMRDERREVELFFHQDFDMYGDETADTCFYHPDHSGVIQYKKSRYVMAEVKKEGGECGDMEQFGIYREHPAAEIESGKLNGNPISQGDVSSAISVKVELPPKGSSRVYYWLNTGRNLDGLLELNEEVEEGIEDLFRRTEMCWRGFVGDVGRRLEGVEDHVREQFRRSVLVVRGQTNDNGAITAANDSSNLEFNQDKYGYVWPRDAALVADVMARAGYPELARPYFNFAEEAIEPEGFLLHKYNPDGSLGSSWHAWVDEEGRKRLPIQEDETALTVWALKRFHEVTGETGLLEEKWESLVRPAAEFMHSYFDPELSLPQPSYDIWEERHYVSTFTVAAVHAGLEAAAEIANEIGEEGDRYRERAAEIRDEGLENLRSDSTERYVRGISDGEKLDEVSAPLFFLEKFGLVDGDDRHFRNTMEAVRHDLSPDTEVGGIARYRGDHYHNVTEDFDRVPGNPWFICTLWVGQHLTWRAKSEEELEEAEEYVDWACRNSLETGILPEQVDPFTGEGKSVAPLTWSHATFIDTALELSQRREELT